VNDWLFYVYLLGLASPVVFVALVMWSEDRRVSRMTPEQQRQHRIEYLRWRYGDAAVNRAMRALPDYYA
jgi:hypothetical protein